MSSFTFPEQTNIERVNALFAVLDRPDEDVEAFWLRVLREYSSKQKILSFSEMEVIEAFTLPSGESPSNLPFVFDRLMGKNQLIVADADGLTHQDSVAAGGGLVMGLISAFSSLWSTPPAPVSSMSPSTRRYMVVSLLKEMSLLVLKQAANKNRPLDAVFFVDPSKHQFSISNFLRDEANLQIDEEVDINFFLGYLKHEGVAVYSQDASIVKIVFPAAPAGLLNATTINTEVDEAYLNIKFMIHSLEASQAKNEEMISSCKALAKDFSNKQKQRNALLELQKKRNIQKEVDRVQGIILKLMETKRVK